MFKISSAFPLLLIMLAGTTFVACDEKDPGPKITNAENAHINSWIRENMEFYYLWNTTLPTDVDQNLEPAEYFEALLNDEDRFSWIQDNYQELLNSLKGISKEAGYEFVLYRDQNDANKVIAQVVYVKKSSPAEDAGLLRGDVISHINNQQLTVSNYGALLDEISENHSLRYKSVDPVSETFSNEKTANLSTVTYAENPSYLNTVIETDGRKIGYYVYNFFAGGPDNTSSTYDNEMDDVFASFKSEGITDLVLDLRFNSGGAETSANNLASLIGAGIDGNSVFARKKYNANLEEVIVNDQELGPDFLTSKFRVKAENIGNQIAGKVYVLTSKRSASASELVINSLKPFMDVIIVGDTTYGKNVGSFSLFDDEDPKNPYGMQPIVVKIFNSLDQSDYSTGFVPNIIHKDNRLFMYPLGDRREALLAQAIAHITGNSAIARAAATKGLPQQQIGHSLDFKRRSFQLIMEGDLKSLSRQ